MPKLVPCLCGHEGSDHTHNYTVETTIGRIARCGCGVCGCDGYRPDFEAVK